MVAVNPSGADSSFGKNLWCDRMKKLPNSIVSMGGGKRDGSWHDFPKLNAKLTYFGFNQAMRKPGYL